MGEGEDLKDVYLKTDNGYEKIGGIMGVNIETIFDLADSGEGDTEF